MALTLKRKRISVCALHLTHTHASSSLARPKRGVASARWANNDRPQGGQVLIDTQTIRLTLQHERIQQVDGEDELKKRQLMELAIINGTYRDCNCKYGLCAHHLGPLAKRRCKDHLGADMRNFSLAAI